MTAKQNAGGAKLEPPQVKRSSGCLGGNEAADVCPPVCDSTERGGDCDRNVGLQRLPSRVDIARPQKRAVTLHPCVTVSMKSVGTFIRSINLRAFPVHAIADQAGGDVERIAFIGPPAINSHRKIFAIRVPIAAGLLLIKSRKLATVMDAAAKLVSKDYRMKHNVEVVFV